MPDSVPQAIIDWMSQQGWQIQQQNSLTGGCVARVLKLSVDTGEGVARELVLKSGGNGFAAEAVGLRALAKVGGLTVPEVYCASEEYLLMAYLPSAPRSADFDERLGAGLALQHKHFERGFGFDITTYCGGTPQPNHWQEDGYSFYAEQRYLSLGRRCLEKRLLSPAEYQQLESVTQQLPELIPEQAPALLHGDLWSGNVISDAQGNPALIDPAAYYGWPEAELAMTLMFGGFSERFYSAYQQVQTVMPGWRQRADLYNLYHYLNHLLLFGGGYHSDVQRIVQYYCR